MWSIVNKEYRQRARGVATVGLIITYTVILGGVAFFVYLSAFAALKSGYSSSGDVGLAMSVGTFIAQMIMALLLSLSLNASTIAHEKDQETFDLLNLTLFRSYEIVVGKFLSSTGFLFILVITALPIYALAFTFGGVSVDAFWRLAAIVVGMTLFISSLGLMMSLISQDVRTALGRSFLLLILLGAVTTVFGIWLTASFGSAPPLLPAYWLGALSYLINPVWAAIDVFAPLSANISWATQPAVVPYLLTHHLWAWSACTQLILTLLVLLLTTLVYPRYRASKTGGVS